jgi:hypothetical protein
MQELTLQKNGSILLIHVQAGFDLWGGNVSPRFRFVYPILEHSGSVGLSPFSIINLLGLFLIFQAGFDLWGQRGEGGGIIWENSSRV